MTRVSVKEAYSNRDLIAQIARLKTYVEQGTFKEVSTSYSGGVLVLTFTAFDDSTQSFSIPMDSIIGITGDQVGSVVTLHVEFASGTVVDIPYTIANADTSPTPDTLGLRDASGKLFAANPANGATDTSLVNANWVSQTGNSSPNNIVHRTGNETIMGKKTFSGTGNIFTIDQTGNPEVIVINAKDHDVTDGVQHFLPTAIAMHDKNGVLLGRLRFYSFPNGRVQISIDVRNADGTTKNVKLAEGNN